MRRSLVRRAAIVAASTLVLGLVNAPTAWGVQDQAAGTVLAFLDEFASWTDGLDEAGALSEPVPLLGITPDGVLDLDSLFDDAFAVLPTDQPLSALDGTYDLDPTPGEDHDALTVDFSEPGGGAQRVLITIDVDETVDASFGVASTSPKVSLGTPGGVSTVVDLSMQFAVVYEQVAGVDTAYLEVGPSTPSLRVDVDANVPIGTHLDGTVGILEVDLETVDRPLLVDVAFSAGFSDPDGDQRLYFTLPHGDPGELAADGSATGLVDVGFAAPPGSASGTFHVIAAPTDTLDLPGIDATVTVDWTTISDPSTLTVGATGFEAVQDFLNLTLRDIADGFGQLTSLLEGIQRARFGETGNLNLPFMRGTLADAIGINETLLKFLEETVYQPEENQALAGQPKWTSLQDLIDELDDRSFGSDIPGATLDVEVGTYNAVDKRLPLTLSMERAAPAPQPLYDPPIEFSGPSATYSAAGFTVPGSPFAADGQVVDLAGRRVVAGLSGGTIASNTANSITLDADWVGGTPGNDTPWSIGSPDVQAGLVELGNVLSGPGGRTVGNANALAPVAEITPSYSASVGIDLDLTAPTPHDPPIEQHNPDGSITLLHETPIGPDRFLIRPADTHFTADLPITTDIDAFATVGFVRVRVGGSLDVCHPTAGADCSGAPTTGEHMLDVALQGTEPMRFGEVFDLLTDTGASDTTLPDDLLDITVEAAAHASGSLSVPDAPTFIGSATAGFSITCAEIVDLTTCTVDTSDLSEIFDLDIEPDNPAALLGVLIKTLQALDTGLLGGSLSGALSERIPMLGVSVKDILGTTESGGGAGVAYANGGGGATLTDPVHGAFDNTDDRMIGRTVVVGTQRAEIVGVAGDTLTFAGEWDPVPTAGTPYAFVTELTELVDQLVQDPPSSLQEALAVANERLASTPIRFRYATFGGPHLVIELDWERSYTATRPVRLDFSGGTLIGTKGSGSASLDASVAVDLGVAVPLQPGDGPAGPAALSVLDDSSVTVGLGASVNGTLQASIGPLSLSLGEPGDPADDIDLQADLDVGLTSPGDGSALQPLTTYLSGLDPDLTTDGVTCAASAEVDEPLAVCGFAPIFYSLNGTTWQPIVPDDGDPATIEANSFALRIPELDDLGDLANVATGTVAKTGGGTLPQLEVPDPTALANLLNTIPLDFDDLVAGLDAYLGLIETGLQLASTGGKLPLAGEDLQQGADFIGDLRQKIKDSLSGLPNGGKASVQDFTDAVNNELATALGIPSATITVSATCGDLPAVTGVAAVATDLGADGATSYVYRVVAYTDTSSTITFFSDPSTAVTNDATLNADNFNTVTWDVNQGADGYLVLRSADGGATFVQVADITDKADTEYVDDGTGTNLPPPVEPSDAPPIADCGTVDPSTVDGVTLSFDVQQGNPSANGCTGNCLEEVVPVDIGIPGLAIRPDRQAPDGDGDGVPDAGLEAVLGYDLHFAVSLTRTDGFVVLTGDPDPELRLGVGIGLVDVPDAADLTAELAILQIEVEKNAGSGAHEFAGLFSVDVTGAGGQLELPDLISDPTGHLTPRLQATVDIDWHIEATVDSALPGVSTDLVIGWGWSSSDDPGDPNSSTPLTIQFNDVTITFGAFFEAVVGPVLREIKRVTGPLKPVIDTLYAPIPVLTDLSKAVGGDEVTIASLALTFNTLADGPDLTFVERTLAVIDLINDIDSLVNSSGDGVNLGDFSIGGEEALAAPATPDRAKDLLVGVTPPADVRDQFETDDAETPLDDDGRVTEAGFAFPLLQNPLSAFGLLLNQDVDIVTWDSGPLELAFDWRQSFGPVYAPPPVYVTISGAAGVRAHIVAGFDTFGIRQAIESGTFTESTIPDAILHGLYFSTNVAGKPLAVLEFFGQIGAGASVSAVIIEVGLEGVIRLTVSFYWNDPTPDGKFRISEFVAVALNNPICLFTVGGRLSLLLVLWVTVGVGPFSTTFDFTIVDVTLLDFSIQPDCEPPPPKLADEEGGILYVFVGKLGNNNLRGDPWGNDGDAAPDEEIVKIYSLHDYTDPTDPVFTGFAVEGFGEYQEYLVADHGAMSTVVVDARDSAKPTKITFLGDGDKEAPPGALPSSKEFEKDAVVLGSDEKDVIRTGTGNSYVDGRGGPDVITTTEAENKVAWVAGGPGEDSITVANGTDVVAGDSELGIASALGDVTLAGRDGDATVNTIVDVAAITPPGDGSGGDADHIGLGLGQNEAFGNGGDDVIGVAAEVGAGEAHDNLIVGGHGGDTISGGAASDEIWTGPEGDPADVVTDGDGEADTIAPDGKQENTVQAGTGDDVVYGSQAVDVVQSSSEEDETALIYGGAGEDVLGGGYGSDEVYGGPDDDYVLAEPADVGAVTGSGDFGPIRSVTRLPLPEGVTPSSDRLVGGYGDDHIIGGDGGAFAWGDTYLPDEQCQPGDPVISDPIGETADAQDGRDKILGGLGIDIVSAGGAADDLSLFAADDLGCGQLGDDVMRGGADDDRLWGGSDVDTEFGEAGIDGVFGNPGGDFLWGGSEADVIEGNNGSDTADGGSAADLVIGGTRAAGRNDSGGDTLYGGTEDDTLIGDNGGPPADGPAGTASPYDLHVTDATPAEGTDDKIFGGDHEDAAYGGLGDDTIDGGNHDDHLEGNNADDTVFGGAGEDELVGGSYQVASPGVGRPDGGDTLNGGGGPDIAIGDNGIVDVLTFGASNPVLRGRAFADAHSITLLDVAGAAPPAYPAFGADLILGDTDTDALLGQAGADRILGQGGDDYAEGGPGTDFVEGNADEDDLVGGSSTPNGSSVPGTGTETSSGQPDNGDVLWGGPSDDAAIGDNGAVLRGDAIVPNAVFDRLGAIPATRAQARQVVLYDLGDGQTPPPAARFGPDWVSGGSEVDFLWGQDGGDAISGGPGADYAEGNGGDDAIRGDALLTAAVTNTGFAIPAQPAAAWKPHPATGPDLLEGSGADGQDDLIGGSSRERFRDETGGGANDLIEGNGEGDMILADDGTLLRVVTGTDGSAAESVDAARYQEGVALPSNAFRLRVGDPAAGGFNGTTRFCTSLAGLGTASTCEPAWAFGADAVWGDGGDDRVWGQDGADTIRGGDGHDDLFGELGDDFLFGEAGEDAILGDRGGVLGEFVDASDGLTQTIAIQQVPQESYVILRPGMLDRRTDLLGDTNGTSWVGTNAVPVPHPGLTEGGEDRIRGGTGRDSIHAGWGDDLANGDGGGDEIFGDDGADVLWGGRGCEGTECPGGDIAFKGADKEFVDHVFGGRGGADADSDPVHQADIIDWNPRGSFEGVGDPGNQCTLARWPSGTPGTVVDPCEWFVMTEKVVGDAVPDQHHFGTDWIYGGWDRDVMQGNETANGPSEFDDRLIDWNGAYNLYSHCNASYGGFNDIRQHSPAMNVFLKKLAYGSGAGRVEADVSASASSAYRELAFTYPADNRDHGSGPAYPTTPGHFDQPTACGT